MMTFTGFHRPDACAMPSVAYFDTNRLYIGLLEMANEYSDRLKRRITNGELKALSDLARDANTIAKANEVLEWANKLFTGQGVESLNVETVFCADKQEACRFVRQGGLDSLTLVYDVEQGKFSVVTCLDFIQEWELRHHDE